MKTSTLSPVVLLAAVLLLAACAGAPEAAPASTPVMDPSGAATAAVPSPTGAAQPAVSEPTPQAEAIPVEARSPVRMAALDLVQNRGVAAESVKLISIEPVQWPDASLGCPAPETVYAQVVTPGYEIRLQAQGVLYTYHSDDGTLVVLCQDGDPAAMPPIPILPGERILDGIPWMPVDPVPDAGSAGDDIVDPAPIK